MKLLSHLPGYETSDVRPRMILIAGAGLFVAVGVSFAVVAEIVIAVTPTERAIPVVQRAELHAGPRLEVHPEVDALQLKQQAAARLQGYRLTEPQAREAHIPIERAIQLLARAGWPDTDTSEARR